MLQKLAFYKKIIIITVVFNWNNNLMNKKFIKLWNKIFVGLFWFFLCLSTAYAASEVSLQDLKQSVQLTRDDNSLINNAIEKVTTLQADIETITSELFALDEKEKEKDPNLTTSYRQARAEIVRVIASIDSASSEISVALKKLVAYQKQMKDLLKQLQDAKTSSEKAKEYLSEYLTLLYKMQLKIYDQEGENIDDIRLFINSNNFNETFIGNDLLSAMTVELWELIERSNQEEVKKTNILSQLWNLKIAAQESIKQYRQEIETLEQKKQYLQSFMQLYKAEANSKFENIFKNKSDVNKMVLTFIDDIVKKNYRTTDNIPENIAKMLSSPDSSDDDAAPIAWPIYPIEKILRYFNDANFEKENGFKHQAIQIQAQQWTPVYAARDGVVYYVSNGIDNISWILIVHKNGYVTVYEYMNQIIVNPWEIVQRGQLIGYSWWEPGTMWAWFASEWENLTFAVYKDWVAVDPLTILDLSVVTNRQNVLPEDYRIKYLNDQLVRPIDVSDLTIMEWKTVDERAQRLLNSYWVWVYKELNFWDSVVNGTNIDRDVVICIALAESTLWQYLTTSNNIGNVWNNDRWDRIAYSTPYAGARLIPTTLNNQHLWHYHTINQLSRYGNPDWKIYASSPINWQTNVMKCLSKIKWYTVPEDFPFRVWPNPNISELENSEKKQQN